MPKSERGYVPEPVERPKGLGHRMIQAEQTILEKMRQSRVKYGIILASIFLSLSEACFDEKKQSSDTLATADQIEKNADEINRFEFRNLLVNAVRDGIQIDFRGVNVAEPRLSSSHPDNDDETELKDDLESFLKLPKNSDAPEISLTETAFSSPANAFRRELSKSKTESTGASSHREVSAPAYQIRLDQKGDGFVFSVTNWIDGTEIFSRVIDSNTVQISDAKLSQLNHDNEDEWSIGYEKLRGELVDKQSVVWKEVIAAIQNNRSDLRRQFETLANDFDVKDSQNKRWSEVDRGDGMKQIQSLLSKNYDVTIFSAVDNSLLSFYHYFDRANEYNPESSIEFSGATPTIELSKISDQSPQMRTPFQVDKFGNAIFQQIKKLEGDSGEFFSERIIIVPLPSGEIVDYTDLAQAQYRDHRWVSVDLSAFGLGVMDNLILANKLTELHGAGGKYRVFGSEEIIKEVDQMKLIAFETGAKEAEEMFGINYSKGLVDNIIIVADTPETMESAAFFSKMYPNTIFQKNDTLRHSSSVGNLSTGFHETVHLIDNALGISTDARWLQIYDESPTDMINSVSENFFKDDGGGHPVSNPAEFLSSFLNYIRRFDDKKYEPREKSCTAEELVWQKSAAKVLMEIIRDKYEGGSISPDQKDEYYIRFDLEIPIIVQLSKFINSK